MTVTEAEAKALQDLLAMGFVFFIGFLFGGEAKQKRKQRSNRRDTAEDQPEKIMPGSCDMCANEATHKVEKGKTTFQLCRECKDLVVERAS